MLSQNSLAGLFWFHKITRVMLELDQNPPLSGYLRPVVHSATDFDSCLIQMNQTSKHTWVSSKCTKQVNCETPIQFCFCSLYTRNQCSFHCVLTGKDAKCALTNINTENFLKSNIFKDLWLIFVFPRSVAPPLPPPIPLCIALTQAVFSMHTYFEACLILSLLHYEQNPFSKPA